jgi:GMP synthase (glutamine-hydrolysing)
VSVLRNAVALRHVEFEDLGLLNGILRAHGFASSYLDAPVNDGGWDGAGEADLLIVLGGPIGVGDADTFPFLAAELEVLEHRFAEHLPTLGICLGAQLLAIACGGVVDAGATSEIGYAPLQLTDAGRNSVLAPLDGLPVLHWHQDVIAPPPEMGSLGFTDTCSTQGFASGTNLLGLQFHLEADPLGLERWLVAYSGDLAAHGIDPRSLRRDAAQYGPALAARAGRVFDAWLSGLEFAT